MAERLKPVELIEEYAAVAEDEAPRAALIWRPTSDVVDGSWHAARTHVAAVRDIELFPDSLEVAGTSKNRAVRWLLLTVRLGL